MEQLTKKHIEDLLLTKALEDIAIKNNRFDCLNDVIDELFENDALNRDEYLQSLKKLTQIGYIESDLLDYESEIDDELDLEIDMLNLEYDIVGLTCKGNEYINKLMRDEETKRKVKDFFAKVDEECNKIANSGFIKLTSAIILPALALLR